MIANRLSTRLRVVAEGRLSGRNLAAGIVLAMLSTVLLTIGLYLPRLVSSHADPIQVAFLRYAGGTLWLLFLRPLRRRHVDRVSAGGIYCAAPLWHVARAIIGFGTLTMTVIASRFLPIGNVQAILACNGLMVLGWIVVSREESLRRPVALATVLCVVGAIVSSQTDFNQRSLAGYAAAVFGSICWAAEIIVFRQAVVRAVGKTSLLFINTVGLVLLVGPAMLRWHAVGVLELCVLMSVGILLVGSQAALIKALERVPLSTTIPIRYLNIPVAQVLGVLVLNQLPTVASIAGAVLIMVGGSVLSHQLSSTR